MVKELWRNKSHCPPPEHWEDQWRNAEAGESCWKSRLVHKLNYGHLSTRTFDILMVLHRSVWSIIDSLKVAKLKYWRFWRWHLLQKTKVVQITKNFLQPEDGAFDDWRQWNWRKKLCTWNAAFRPAIPDEWVKVSWGSEQSSPYVQSLATACPSTLFWDQKSSYSDAPAPLVSASAYDRMGDAEILLAFVKLLSHGRSP